MKNSEILNELNKMEISIKAIRDFIGNAEHLKLIKTTSEFSVAFNQVAQYLAKSDNKNTIKGLKTRLTTLKKVPTVLEAYEIQDKFGIPVYAWKDINWYKKTLLP